MGSKSKKSSTVIIAGGGTGGHIYPAIAIARAIQAQDESIEIQFVGSTTGLENTIVPREGFPLYSLPIGKVNVGWAERIKTLFGLPWVFVKSLWLLLKLRPRFILGVGGYASAPILFTGSLIGVPCYLWEPNAHPGLANRWLAPRVKESLVVFDAAREHMSSRKFTHVGMPVRKQIESIEPQSRQQSQPFRLLVFGGSQGAMGLNNVVSDAICNLKGWLDGIEIVHQTGEKDFDRIQHKYDSCGAKVEAADFLHDMDQRYAWADLVVCRAGASTIAELAASGKASVLVPFPFASDDHQQKNAQVLVDQDAARMIVQKDLTPELFVKTITELKNRPESIDEMSKKIKKFHRPRAAEEISRHLLSLH